MQPAYANVPMTSITLLYAGAERGGMDALLHSVAAFCGKYPDVAAAYLFCAIVAAVAAIAIFYGGNLKD